MAPEPSTSEDCLFLNVWAPAGHVQAVASGRAALLPVVLFIHGGAFFMGSGANPSTSPPPDAFVRAAGAVFVTLNYRLGVLGFMVSSALPGNGGLQGIQDQILAMTWVHQHISAFGGDPSRVTLQGESAGAISICLHLVLPASRGLFHRAILQSGLCSYPFEEIGVAYAGKERLSTAVGCHKPTTTAPAASGGGKGHTRHPARPPPTNVIISRPLETGDGLVQLPGEGEGGGALGGLVEREAHELAEEQEREGQSPGHPVPHADVPTLQAAALWLRSSVPWPWTAEDGVPVPDETRPAPHLPPSGVPTAPLGSGERVEGDAPAQPPSRRVGLSWVQGALWAVAPWAVRSPPPPGPRPPTPDAFPSTEWETSAHGGGRAAYAPPVWSPRQLARDEEELTCLRATPAANLLSALQPRRGVFFYEGQSWGPIVDGILLRDHPLRLIQTGQADVAGIDILYGHNADEASVFVLFAWPVLVSKPLLWEFVASTLGPGHAQRVWDTYVEGAVHPEVEAAKPRTLPSPSAPSTRGAHSASGAEEPLRLKAVKMLNHHWQCASFAVAGQLAAHGARVRLYQFQHTPSFLSEWLRWLGAFHGAELDFALAAFNQHDPSPAEAKLSAHMMRLWAEFVTGQRLRVQHSQTRDGSWPAGGAGSATATLMNFTFVADTSPSNAHPPLAVHEYATRARRLLPRSKPDAAYVVPGVVVDPADVHVTDAEWPLYAPPSVDGSAGGGSSLGHGQGVCLNLRAEPGFTLSPRASCRPAECTLWDATLTHGFMLRMPPQMREPLWSRVGNAWVPKALRWLSAHLPHLNVAGVVTALALLTLLGVPAGRALSSRVHGWWREGEGAVPAHRVVAALAGAVRLLIPARPPAQE